MADDFWRGVTGALRAQGVGIDPGLSGEELGALEAAFAFRFPPDLRALLGAGVPAGPKFPAWRGDKTVLAELFAAPLEGILFDVEHNGIWLAAWGERPAATAKALAVVRRLVAAAPRLVPVYAHRSLPDEPALAGNPVFSVHQTDIILYGTNLVDYLNAEFGMNLPADGGEARRIRFWDDFIG